jgi:arsenate reductase
LVNQEHPSYSKRFEHHDFSTDDWIKMIRKNPQIMKQPIALKGDIAILIETPTDIINL